LELDFFTRKITVINKNIAIIPPIIKIKKRFFVVLGVFFLSVN